MESNMENAKRNEELRAVSDIMGIIDKLGGYTGSCVGKAFEGCIEIALSNIWNNERKSMKDMADILGKKVGGMLAEANRYRQRIDELEAENCNKDEKSFLKEQVACGCMKPDTDCNVSVAVLEALNKEISKIDNLLQNLTSDMMHDYTCDEKDAQWVAEKVRRYLVERSTLQKTVWHYEEILKYAESANPDAVQNLYLNNETAMNFIDQIVGIFSRYMADRGIKMESAEAIRVCVDRIIRGCNLDELELIDHSCMIESEITMKDIEDAIMESFDDMLDMMVNELKSSVDVNRTEKNGIRQEIEKTFIMWHLYEKA